MCKVIVLDNLAEDGLRQLSAAPGISFEVRTGLKGNDLREALLGVEGAICRSGVQITSDSLTGNRRLKAVVRAGVGTDNIDKLAATREGIVVMNTPTGNTISTAEHAFTLMLAMSRNVAPAYQNLIEGHWERKAFMGSQLAGKTLGIVGLGRIGQEVALRAAAFQMRIVGYDPFISKERAADLGIELAETVPDMLPKIDYLTVHTPLTPETEGLIGLDELELMRPGVRLVNCARGGIYDEQALLVGLETGKLAGVALDVYRNEPCIDSPLFGRPGVLCTPHLGASTEEAQTQVAVEAVELIVNFLSRGEVRHSVNMAAVDPKMLQSMRGYLDVAHRLGLFLGQWNPGNTSSCSLRYRGEVARKDTKLLTTAFCAGLVEKAMQEEVNIVNAELVLQERGIDVVTQCQTDQGAFSSSITAEIVADGHTYTAGGTLFGSDMPRLFRLDDYRLEAYLDGVLFVFMHRDVPGIIGAVGTIFGTHEVNIAQMAVGCAGEEPGGDAIGVLNLGTAPPCEAVEEVLSHPDIHKVSTIHLPAAGKLPPWLQS